MRTTVTIQDTLLEEAKKAALRRKSTLGSVLDDALRVFLLDRKQKPEPPPKPIPTFKGNGLQPGIDLSSNASLLDEMEDR